MKESKHQAYVSEVFHVAHEVTLGVHDLIDRLLTLLLRVRDARDDLRRDGMDPERARFLLQQNIHTYASA